MLAIFIGKIGRHGRGQGRCHIAQAGRDQDRENHPSGIGKTIAKECYAAADEREPKSPIISKPLDEKAQDKALAQRRANPISRQRKPDHRGTPAKDLAQPERPDGRIDHRRKVKDEKDHKRHGDAWKADGVEDHAKRVKIPARHLAPPFGRQALGKNEDPE